MPLPRISLALALTFAVVPGLQSPPVWSQSRDALRLGEPELAMARAERRVEYRDTTLLMEAVAVDGSLECRRSRGAHDRIDRCQVSLTMVVSAESRPRGRATVECAVTLEAQAGGDEGATERPTAARERSVSLSQGQGRTLLTISLRAATPAGWDRVDLRSIACRMPRVTLF
ncbi:hypothetical protein [Sediminicurvatus halobius]|uniref:Uncharacterized protein n=1 Tax=Sediminicurvatus halobius TaxID=2182432 RepID=A0A2U2N9P3_9GAMM|nr:hypothetical protein [Spiribacter halobius]PWG65812.1 hypothetical protein DEM34_00675 [Spiribacter halobius]UEX77854.1 hypothetical protein LMH63_18310 [Spiribacter halobius]